MTIHDELITLKQEIKKYKKENNFKLQNLEHKVEAMLKNNLSNTLARRIKRFLELQKFKSNLFINVYGNLFKKFYPLLITMFIAILSLCLLGTKYFFPNFNNVHPTLSNIRYSAIGVLGSILATILILEPYYQYQKEYAWNLMKGIIFLNLLENFTNILSFSFSLFGQQQPGLFRLDSLPSNSRIPYVDHTEIEKINFNDSTINTNQIDEFKNNTKNLFNEFSNNLFPKIFKQCPDEELKSIFVTLHLEMHRILENNLTIGNNDTIAAIEKNLPSLQASFERTIKNILTIIIGEVYKTIEKQRDESFKLCELVYSTEE